MARKEQAEESVCRNRKAQFQYELIEKLECGIVLTGTEVKSLRERNASLDEAFARIDGDELTLVGFHIAAYKHGTSGGHDPNRRRRLLVHRRQLRKLKQAVTQKGLTLVALAVYFNERGLAKVSIALARGKGRADKRQTIKSREAKREIARHIQRRK